MKIYSETTVSFALKCEKMLKEIIKNEVGFQVARTRFTYLKHTYPLKIVIICSDQNYGYFDPHTYQIGIHRNLMYEAKDDVIKNILRHEFAHYLCFIMANNQDTPHGPAFKSICAKYGWTELVSKASINLDLANESMGNLESEKIITKVKALLKLAESDNPHEAELATLKANQLLLKHNIKHLEQDSFSLYVDNVITAKKRNTKLMAIYEILQHFLVKPVFIYGKNQVSIEVSGQYENLELARYVANYLDAEFERLWKAQTELKGLRAKNSFFMGIAKGYDEKIKAMQAKYDPSESRALVKLKTELDTKIEIVYRNLSFTKSKRNHDDKAYGQGKKNGKNLTINKAVKSSTRTKLINWR